VYVCKVGWGGGGRGDESKSDWRRGSKKRDQVQEGERKRKRERGRGRGRGRYKDLRRYSFF
jgi:hypothetical protein